MFKSIKKRNVRKRRHSSDAESDEEKPNEEESVSLRDLKEIQRLRRRTKGVNADDLLQVQDEAETETKVNDPFKIKTGGYIDVKALKKEGISLKEAEQIGTSFAVETNRRDEDADMLKYVEAELAKRKGITSEQDEDDNQKDQYKSAEQLLYEIPEHLKELSSKKKKSEDMLSNQMLSGIPEVDLGIDAKIRNIEATEEAKQKLIEERRKKRNKDEDFVPTNMAVNFVQHKRFNVEDSATKRPQKKVEPEPEPVRVGDADKNLIEHKVEKKERGMKGEKASDEFVYQKFKKWVVRR